jgi:Mrp family chromosome partitioning ATPase
MAIATALRTAAPHVDAPARRTQPTHPMSRVELDLERLRALGFITPDAPLNQIADEFRVVKRPIIRNALGKEGIRVKNGNLVMVTSALPGEGKTFTSLNLALSIALEYDNTVLLVDGDVAHPTMPSLLGAPNSPGLLDLLTRDDVDVADALVKTNVEKLSLLPAGSRHRRPPSFSRASRWRACCASSRPATPTASSCSIRRRCSRPPRRACSRR